MEHAHQYRPWVALLVGVLVLAEIIWSWKNDKHAYQVKETFSNLAILAGFQFSKFLFAGYQLAIMGYAAKFALWDIPHTWWAFAITFLLADFVYYWFHRASHSWKPLWAFHLIHHSSLFMNLTTAYRLNWFSAVVSPLFFVPLALLGFPIDFIVASYALNLVYQFFLHTEAIGKLGVLEGYLDTPSAHRVHHGSNPEYIDKNFGGVLLIWDRFFNTYQPETIKATYGVTTGFISYNPIKLVMQGFIDLFKNRMTYKG